MKIENISNKVSPVKSDTNDRMIFMRKIVSKNYCYFLPSF